MNLLRRTFLKAIAASPLAFLLPKTERPTVAMDKAQPGQDWTSAIETNIFNGTCWKASWPCCHIVIVLFWDIENGQALYVLLSKPYEAADHPGTVMLVCHYDDPYKSHGRFSPFYTEAELARKLTGWEQLPLMTQLAKDKSFQIPREVLETDV